MSHLLLAPSGRGVFNSAASPSFDFPSSFLSIETIVSSRAGQYLRSILSLLYTQHLVTSSFDPSLPQTELSTRDVLIRLVPLSDRARTPRLTPTINITAKTRPKTHPKTPIYFAQSAP
jgi:hypothetical protein